MPYYKPITLPCSATTAGTCIQFLFHWVLLTNPLGVLGASAQMMSVPMGTMYHPFRVLYTIVKIEHVPKHSHSKHSFVTSLLVRTSCSASRLHSRQNLTQACWHCKTPAAPSFSVVAQEQLYTHVATVQKTRQLPNKLT